MQSLFLLALAIVIAASWGLRQYLAPEHDPREPTLVPSSVPLVGHIIGLIRHKSRYYVELRRKFSLPICTLALPKSKLYIVNFVDLVSSVQRLHKELSFRPIEAKFATRLCASGKEANDILTAKLDYDDGDSTYSAEVYRLMHPALAPGPGLDGLNHAAVLNIADSLERLKPQKNRPVKIRLGAWSRHETTMATTNAVYGSHNPFKSPGVEDAFWTLQDSIAMLLVNLFPSITARKGFQARDVLSKAFQAYFKANHHGTGSMLVQCRYQSLAKKNVPLADIARYEACGSIAILVNTAPSVFWTLFYLYSQPELLRECRKEVESIMSVVESENGVQRILHISRIRQQCLVLSATFQEALRLQTVGMQVRQVMQDTMLDDTYLLRKDGIVMMPSRVVHTDPSVWGPDVYQFNHKRFLKNTRGSKEGKKPSPHAFRTFGGGTTLCPGRHFATTEVLAMAAMMIMRYDLMPVEGKWITPKTEKTNIVAGIMEPDTDIEAEVIARQGLEDGEWKIEFADSNMVLAVAADDISD